MSIKDIENELKGLDKKKAEKLMNEMMEKIKKIKAGKEKKKKSSIINTHVDEVTLLSEKSLSKEWLSKEDDRYEKYYKD